MKPSIFAALLGLVAAGIPLTMPTAPADDTRVDAQHQWIGTWGAAPQRSIKGRVQTFDNQTLRLIVHVSAGGNTIRVKLSNVFGEQPLVIGSAHVARRIDGATIEPGSDRALTFGKRSFITIAPGRAATSDPIALEVSGLSDLAVSLFLPKPTSATTLHILAQQTSYVTTAAGDYAAAPRLVAVKTISAWPFLTGIDVLASSHGATVVAFGSSLTDGDGSTTDTNRRYPDVLAERLQANGDTQLGVLNEGIIGNRLLSDSQSPGQTGGPSPLGPVFEQLGQALGDSGIKRFDRDVVTQSGVRYVILALGVNDILFPGTWVPAAQTVTAKDLISGNRTLIARARERGLRVIGTTIPPFEHALFKNPPFDAFYSAEKDSTREEVNAWIRSSHEFDGVIDFDAAVRDPDHPSQLRPAYDSGDHLHPNNAGNVAEANAISLALFGGRQ